MEDEADPSALLCSEAGGIGDVEAEDAAGTDSVALSSALELRPSAVSHMVQGHKRNRLMVSKGRCQAALELSEKLSHRQNYISKPN